MVEKAETDFYKIIEQEKKKQSPPVQDFEKTDVAQVIIAVVS